MSSRYDDVTEQLIDDNMCTKDVCPCLNYNIHDQYANPRHLYREHFEVYMEKYNRTNYDDSFWSKEHGDKPLYFTENVNEGYKSFMECYSYWVDKAQKNDTIQLQGIFNISKSVY